MMKDIKAFALACTALACGINANAQVETIGSTEAGYNSAFSEAYTIEDGGSYHFVYTVDNVYNQTWNGNDGWENPLLVIAPEHTHNAGAANNYFTLRSDRWGWGTNYDAAGWGGTLNDLYKLRLDAASVDMTIAFANGVVTMTSTITNNATYGGSGTYTYNFTSSGSINADEVVAYFTIEKCQIVIEEATYTAPAGETPGGNDTGVDGDESFPKDPVAVGNADFSSGWWSAFSSSYTLEKDKEYHFVIENFSDKVENWHNWVLIAANAQRGADGYAEYFALRADHYGWGNNYDASGLYSAFNWSTFKDDLDGSTTDMYIKYTGGKIVVTSYIHTTGGKTLPYNFTSNGTISANDVTVFFTVENAHINVLKAEVLKHRFSISAAGYATLVMPMSAPVPAGLTVSTITGVDAHNGLVLQKVNTIEANKAYLVQGAEGDYRVFGSHAENSTIVQNGLLMGTYEDIQAPLGSYVLQKQDETVGFYLVDGVQPTVGANRAYLTVPSAAGARAFFFAGEETGIKAVENEGNGAIYNMAGQKVGSDYKGIVIKNGKKMLVK